MHIGTQNFGIQNHAAHQARQRASQAQNHDHASRSERLVARHDANDDGKLSTAELQDTRLGKKMSIDRFARLDKNGDGQLEAGELNRRGRHHGHDHHNKPSTGPSQVESALVAKFADLLAAPATPPEPPANLGEDIAKALLSRLDKDDSGALNSEEIAGSKLAEKIGAGFYDLDGDKNGALDTAELSAFITEQFLGAAETDDADAVDETGEVADVAPLAPTEPTDAADAVEPVEETPAVTAPVDAAGPSYADSLRASFEAALEVLEKGNEQQQAALNVVRTLYAEANKAFS